MQEIDFVLTYLDSNDIAWQKQRNLYKSGENADVNPNRYRDWDNLIYFFRSIEKYAPWVHKIHVVTWGHLPEWLNTEHPKINIVKHEDYIPQKWLPTFSSRCIDMNLHRIPGLSEKFVYFNDDMFITAPVEPKDFFKDGLPCDCAVLSPQAFRLTDGICMHIAPIVGTALINRHFHKNQVIKKNFGKWINLKYGKELFRTFTMIGYPNFIGFRNFHVPYSYLKSTYQTLWNLEPELLQASSEHKFRELNDLNHWIFSYWQFASGNFSPRRASFGKCYQIHTKSDAEKAAADIRNHSCHVICVNDGIEDEKEFLRIKKCVNSALDSIFPKRSKFEK